MENSQIVLNKMYKIKYSSFHKCGIAQDVGALYLKFTKSMNPEYDSFGYDLFTSADSTSSAGGCSHCYEPCDVEEIKQVTKKHKKNIEFIDEIQEIKELDLNSVVMDDEKKEQIIAAISQIKNHDKIFNKWGFSDVIEKGTAVSLLFWGPPGTGKTMTAQAIAKTLDMKFKLIQTAEIETSEPGGAERNIKKIFAEAEEKNELLLLDECDSLITNRSKMGVILAAQVNALLTCLESFKGVVVFTTNRLGTLDPAFERRVSAKIEFEVPDKEQRKMIWQKMIPSKAPICKKIDWEKISEIEICGGNIKNAVLNAARYAAYKGMKKINQECFEKGLEKEVNGMIGFKQNEGKQEVSQADFTRSRGLISTQS